MQESYLADCRFKKMEWKGLNLKRASFFHTPLKGMDLRGNEIEGIVLSEEKVSQFGLEAETRLHEVGFASNRASAMAR